MPVEKMILKICAKCSDLCTATLVNKSKILKETLTNEICEQFGKYGATPYTVQGQLAVQPGAITIKQFADVWMPKE